MPKFCRRRELNISESTIQQRVFINDSSRVMKEVLNKLTPNTDKLLLFLCYLWHVRSSAELSPIALLGR